MNTKQHLKACCFTATLLTIAPATFAQTYDWLSWTYPTSQTATANAPGLGSVGLAVSGPSTNTSPFPIQFIGVPFNPVLADSVGAGHNTPALDLWTISLDFTSLAGTAGLIVGLGNFGHGSASYPGYSLSAFSPGGAQMALTDFSVIGNYDHVWTANGGILYNDDTSLDMNTGFFGVNPVPGGNDSDSDILLLSLPAGVGHLTINPINPSSGDTINVMIATVVPEPSTVMLGAIGILGIFLRRRRNATNA